MKVIGSEVALTARSSYASETTVTESLQVSLPAQAGASITISFEPDLFSLTDQARDMLSAERKLPGSEGEPLYQMDARDRQKLDLLNRFFKALTGKNLRFCVPDRVTMQPAGKDSAFGLRSAGDSSGSASAAPGFAYSRTTTVKESQSLAFQAVASVRTADGREINVNLSLLMQSSFEYTEHFSIRSGSMVDPLVINFGAAGASLTQNKFDFDLNFDGTTDRISFAGPGSGFLVYDANGDGVINDGRELFGPSSGNGFAELAAYDCDGNGWIDENDSIYEHLQIWVRDPDGTDRLFALGEKGIGAIYLGNVSADYLLGSPGASPDGQIRRTGFFLRENGSAGTMQHVDIAV